MSTTNELKAQIKSMLVENLMLQIAPDTIGDDLPLFGPNGLGLDSVDALQLVVALDKNYGLKISDSQAAKGILQDVNSIAAAIEKMNTDFADILLQGKIEQSAALPEEKNEPELASLPRLVLVPDQRHYGRIRQLIDAVNDLSE